MRLRFAFSMLASGLTLAAVVGCCAAGALGQARPRRRHATICGNPKIACKTSVTFEPHNLPFRIPMNAVILDTELFYAIILKSVSVKDDNCDVFIPETERLTTQALFSDHKVFTSRCYEPGELFYEDVTTRKVRNISETHRIMAVYAGKTLAEAKRFLDSVKATGKFPGANIRRMRTGFNGT